MIITGTTSMAIPSPLVSPFTAYSRNDASYHAYFVFHTTSLSVEGSYLDIEADAELSDDIYITVLKHNDLEDCYVIDVMCPYYEYQGGESSAVTYHLTGKIYGETLVKHLNIDVTFEQDGCEKYPEWSGITEVYTITWLNYDGTELLINEALEGSLPEYTGEEPSRPSEGESTFVFAGWTPAITPAISDATYTALFNEVLATYTITYIDGNGDVLITEQYHMGETPVYSGQEPTKAPTEMFEYEFNGQWNPSIGPVTGDTSYTALFDAHAIAGECSIVYTSPAQLENIDAGTYYDYGTNVTISSHQYDQGLGFGIINFNDSNCPDKIEELDETVGFNDNDMTSIVFPESIKLLGDGIFFGDYDLIFADARHVEVISAYTFEECGFTALLPVDDPISASTNPILVSENLTFIDYSAFEMCELEYVNIPNSVTEIGESAFRDCYISAITIGDGIMQIDSWAFNRSSSRSDGNKIRTVTCYAETPPSLGTGVFNVTMRPTLYVPESAISDYENSDWNDYFNGRIRAIPS